MTTKCGYYQSMLIRRNLTILKYKENKQKYKLAEVVQMRISSIRNSLQHISSNSQTQTCSTQRETNKGWMEGCNKCNISITSPLQVKSWISGLWGEENSCSEHVDMPDELAWLPWLVLRRAKSSALVSFCGSKASSFPKSNSYSKSS